MTDAHQCYLFPPFWLRHPWELLQSTLTLQSSLLAHTVCQQALQQQKMRNHRMQKSTRLYLQFLIFPYREDKWVCQWTIDTITRSLISNLLSLARKSFIIFRWVENCRTLNWPPLFYTSVAAGIIFARAFFPTVPYQDVTQEMAVMWSKCNIPEHGRGLGPKAFRAGEQDWKPKRKMKNFGKRWDE